MTSYLSPRRSPILLLLVCLLLVRGNIFFKTENTQKRIGVTLYGVVIVVSDADTEFVIDEDKSVAVQTGTEAIFNLADFTIFVPVRPSP